MQEAMRRVPFPVDLVNTIDHGLVRRRHSVEADIRRPTVTVLLDTETVAPGKRSELAESLCFQDPPDDARQPTPPDGKTSGCGTTSEHPNRHGPTTTDCILGPLGSQVVLDILDLVVDFTISALTSRNPDGTVLAAG
jgi:hypothetical protein